MSLPDDDPERMNKIRTYSAIYGRFDCKRKPEKPLTLHEVSVNEAAAQICKHIPALLTRRDELFPLARQAVRISGYQYSKGHSRSQFSLRSFDFLSQSGDSLIGGEHSATAGGSGCPTGVAGGNAGARKRRGEAASPPQTEATKIKFAEVKKRQQDRLETVIDQLKNLRNEKEEKEELKHQLEQNQDLQNFQQLNQVEVELEQITSRQEQLSNEENEIKKQLKEIEKQQSTLTTRTFSRTDTRDDESDSQLSMYSNESSASMSQDLQGDSPNHESSQNSNDFSRIISGGRKSGGNGSLPAPMGGNLMKDVCFDEGLRIAKEYQQGVASTINTEPEISSENQLGMDLRILNAKPEPLLGPRQPRPRGRPPKFVDRDRDATSSSAAVAAAAAAAYHQFHSLHGNFLSQSPFNIHHSSGNSSTGSNGFSIEHLHGGRMNGGKTAASNGHSTAIDLFKNVADHAKSATATTSSFGNISEQFLCFNSNNGASKDDSMSSNTNEKSL